MTAPDGVERSANGSSPGELPSPAPEDPYDRGGSRSLALVVAATADEPVQPAVVANLAAAFAASGRRVTVLRIGWSARRRSPGTEDVAVGTPPTRDTSIAGVRVVEWAPEYGAASPPDVVEILREDRTVVLVDTGRVATAEFAEVAPVIDGVVAVCQIGRTTIENAERTADVVAWSHARLLGVVLAQVPANTVERIRWGRRRRSPLTPRGGGAAGTEAEDDLALVVPEGTDR
jgi:hypothetical protein